MVGKSSFEQKITFVIITYFKERLGNQRKTILFSSNLLENTCYNVAVWFHFIHPILNPIPLPAPFIPTCTRPPARGPRHMAPGTRPQACGPRHAAPGMRPQARSPRHAAPDHLTPFPLPIHIMHIFSFFSLHSVDTGPIPTKNV